MKISRVSRLSLMNGDHFLAFGGIYENIRIFKESMFFLHFNFHYIYQSMCFNNDDIVSFVVSITQHPHRDFNVFVFYPLLERQRKYRREDFEVVCSHVSVGPFSFSMSLLLSFCLLLFSRPFFLYPSPRCFFTLNVFSFFTFSERAISFLFAQRSRCASSSVPLGRRLTASGRVKKKETDGRSNERLRR